MCPGYSSTTLKSTWDIFRRISGKYQASTVSHLKYNDNDIIDVKDICNTFAEQFGSKRHSLQAVELSQRTQAAVQIVTNLPAPAMGARFTVFWACGPAGWLALLLTKAGDVKKNPGPTTSHKRVWICDICYK